MMTCCPVQGQKIYTIKPLAAVLPCAMAVQVQALRASSGFHDAQTLLSAPDAMPSFRRQHRRPRGEGRKGGGGGAATNLHWGVGVVKWEAWTGWHISLVLLDPKVTRTPHVILLQAGCHVELL